MFSRAKLELTRDLGAGEYLNFGNKTLDLAHWTSRMINCSERDGYLTFSVRVVPRASRSEVVGEHSGALRVRIAAPPVDGAANEELVRLLSRTLGVSRSAIEIRSGLTAKLKVVRVTGLARSALADLAGSGTSRAD